MRGKCRKGSDSWYDEGNVCLAIEYDDEKKKKNDRNREMGGKNM
jgi:hypothetical protein